jgi:hypothetical protein
MVISSRRTGAGNYAGILISVSAATFSVLEMQHSPFGSAIFGNYIMQLIWWEEIISGEYQNYYEKMYGDR